MDMDPEVEEDIEEGSSSKEKLEKFLDNTYVTIFVSIVTLWALFGDDIRIVCCNAVNFLDNSLES